MRRVQLLDRATTASTLVRPTTKARPSRIICVGEGACDILRRQLGRRSSTSSTCAPPAPWASSTRTGLPRAILGRFEAGEFDVATLFYSRFRSVIAQVPTAQPIVPAQIQAGARALDAVYDYQAGRGEILATLTTTFVTVQIFRALLENAASEQGARMSAMDNHRNAGRHDQEADHDLQSVASGHDHRRNSSKSSRAPRRSDRCRKGSAPWPRPPPRPPQSETQAAIPASRSGTITQVIGAVVDVQFEVTCRRS